jgi:hypothetical protein
MKKQGCLKTLIDYKNQVFNAKKTRLEKKKKEK